MEEERLHVPRRLCASSQLCNLSRACATAPLPRALSAIPWPEPEEDEEPLSAECRDLIHRLLALDPRGRLGHRGAGEVKLHPWFAGVDWPSLARAKAAFVPMPDCDTDTSYFSSKPVSQMSLALDLDGSRPPSEAGEGAPGGAGWCDRGLPTISGGGSGGPPSQLASPASLPTSRASSRSAAQRGGGGLSSRRASSRRRSLRHALAEPTAACWDSLASAASSDGSNCRGPGGDGGGAAAEAEADAALGTAAELLRRRTGHMASFSGSGASSLRRSSCAMSADGGGVSAGGKAVGAAAREDGAGSSLPSASVLGSAAGSSSGRSALSEYSCSSDGTPMSLGGGDGEGLLPEGEERGEGEGSPNFR